MSGVSVVRGSCPSDDETSLGRSQQPVVENRRPLRDRGGVATQNVDVVIVGAGVMGSSIALELAARGRQVLVIDKGGGVGHGSTSASSSIVRFHYSTFAGVALAWESLYRWRKWTEHLGCVDPAGLAQYYRSGMVVLEDADQPPAALTGLYDRVGVPWEWWDSATLAQRLPFIDTGAYGPPVPVDSEEFFADAHGQLSATYTADAGYISDPQLAARNLAVAAQLRGARFQLRCLPASIEPTGPRRWHVSLGEGDHVHADVVVNAAGPWSSAVNRLAGVGGDFAVTSRPLRQEVHEVAAPEGYEEPGGRPGIGIADPDLGVYVRGTGKGRMIIGGMEPACDPLHWLESPEESNVHPTMEIFRAQVMRTARRFPGLSVPIRPTGISGVYDATVDWTPIYDRTGEDGFYVAMGTSGNQFKNAPVVGLLMAELIDAIEAGQDHDHDPVQLRLPETGNVVDLSAFSRLRVVDPEGPANVMG